MSTQPKCPSGFSISAHEGDKCECSVKIDRSIITKWMFERYGSTSTTMRHRNDRRLKDARKSWKREEW